LQVRKTNKQKLRHESITWVITLAA